MGAVAAFGSVEAQIGMLGTWISILAGLVLTQIKSTEDYTGTLTKLLPLAGLAPALVHHPEILENYIEISQALSDLSAQTDPVLLEFAANKLDSLAEQVQAMARGELTFSSTEAWRMIYEKILRCERVKKYRSVAWFKSPEYWQDGPGRKSLQLNLELRSAGLNIERIVIVPDDL